MAIFFGKWLSPAAVEIILAIELYHYSHAGCDNVEALCNGLSVSLVE